jgi:raffinose/stachyose/melibiose transport system permease protein
MASGTLRSQGWARKLRLGGPSSTVLIMLPPALILFTLFVILPLIDAAYYSLYDWNGYGTPTDYVGTENFAKAANHSIFHRAILNTLIGLGVAILIQMPLALALAIAIYKNSWVNTVFRLVFFVPFILAEVATGLIWSFVFDGNTGLAAGLANIMGSEPFFVLASRDYAFYAIMAVVVWKYFGFHMMIYIAALQSVPDEQIEAAKIEGAKRGQIIWHVLIPGIKPALMVSGFFAVIGSLQLFDVILPLTGGGPSNTTHTVVSYLYSFGLLRLNYGFGSAVGVMLFVAAVVVAVVYQRQMNKGAAQ